MDRYFIHFTTLKMAMLFAWVTILAIPAMAGDADGGGGDVFLGKFNDQVILADYLYSRVPELSSQDKLPEEIIPEINRIGFLLSWLGAKIDDEYIKDHQIKWTSTVPQIITDNVLDPGIRYHFVDKLPDIEQCQISKEEQDLPFGTKIRVACSLFNDTWILKAITEKKDIKITLGDFAMLLVHEGFRRIPNMTTGSIRAITTGLNTARIYLNSQLAGDRSELPQSARYEIQTAFEAIQYLGLSRFEKEIAVEVSRKYAISKNGGILLRDSEIADTNFFGIGSFLKDLTTLGTDNTFLGSNICWYAKCTIGTRVKVVNSEVHQNLYQQDLGNDISIVDSFVLTYSLYGINHFELHNSTLGVPYLKTNPKTSLNFYMRDSSLTSDLTLRLKKNVKITNLKDGIFRTKRNDENAIGTVFLSAVATWLTGGGYAIIGAPLGFFYNISSSFTIDENVTLDFANFSCPSGSNTFNFNHAMRPKIKQVEDLIKYCE